MRMRSSMLRIVSAFLTALLLTACAPSTLSGGPSSGHLRAESVTQTEGAIPQPVQQIVPLPRPRTVEKTETYSVVVNNIKVQDLLFALARDAKLNVDIHPGITGYVSLNAIDQTLPQLLTRIAKQVDMRFELDGPNLAVMPDTPYLKNYKIDYVNMSRDVTGTVSTNTQISTSAVNTTGGSTPGGGNTSRLQIENKSRNHFWESLEKNLKDLLHETDKIFPEGSTETVTEQNSSQSTTGTGSTTPTVNAARGSRVNQTLAGSPNPAAMENSGATVVKRMTFREAASVISSPESGTITVRATSRQHEKVQEFIDRVMRSARRQVLIEATIVEVELSDGYQQGIEWSRIRDDKTASSPASGFVINQPTLGTNPTNSVTPFIFSYFNKSNPLNLLSTVNLLQSFGNLKVLSSPKLTVLNNQTATLKVSEEFVYFNVKSDIAAGTLTTGPTKAFTTTPQSVSIGFFMSLTAQISDNDTVTLNVRPSISSISDLKQDPNPDLAAASIKNLVPQIRTREIESLMRIESGDIAVLGGLMEDRMDNKTGRFPGLGDIPLFGELLNNRSNTSRKTELVIFIRPTVIRDASIQGDFGNFSGSLPNKEFFKTDKIFQPFSGPSQPQEPLK
ncbi:MAG: pilus (MSHA type) biogenesis protein MshL [Propionivibrio sp.]|nr:pilus (MSHA type) biogenesis protein MshL [Propionivibrio sp.]MBK8894724.1 pilus (MSHA type) biogenesis protein MshL [Propionivibrio sp.]